MLRAISLPTYLYSDRDLLTRENSPVSGLTLYTYDEHGELATETDARGVTVTRTVDALDPVTFIDFPDDTLDITYTYDDPSVDFSLGRLTQIERNGSSGDYHYMTTQRFSSSTSRTFRAKALGANGFCKKAIFSSIKP